MVKRLVFAGLSDVAELGLGSLFDRKIKRSETLNEGGKEEFEGSKDIHSATVLTRQR